MPVELSYSDVESTLARLNRIAEDKRIAFRARLKHFQRLGFPKGANTGTGKRVAYSVQMLFQMALATELTQAGLSPKRIVEILDKNWIACETALLFALTLKDRWSPPLADNNLVLLLSPESLRDLSEDGEGEHDYYEAIEVLPLSEVENYMLRGTDQNSPIVGEFYRHLLIQLRPFGQRVMWHLSCVREEIEFSALTDDLEAGAAERNRRSNALAEELSKGLDESGDGNDT